MTKVRYIFSLLNLCLINNQNVNNSIVLNYNYMAIQYKSVKSNKRCIDPEGIMAK